MNTLDEPPPIVAPPPMPGTPVSGVWIAPYSFSTVLARAGTFGAVTDVYFMPSDDSCFLTAGFAAAPTRNASTLLYREIPVSPSRLISLSVTRGMPFLVTYRTGASSGKWISGVAVIAVSGSSGVNRVSAHGRSGSLLFSFGAFAGSAAGQMCWVTDAASWNGLAP